jgi:glycosyltransferase involved in cell wall biosynthesis
LTPRVTPDGDRDGIPNVLVEAMACGLPVVTTSAGGVTELVRHGVNGLVSRPGDVAGIASHLRELLNNPRSGQDLATAARRTVEADYDVNTAAAALERLFSHAEAAPGVAPVGAT